MNSPTDTACSAFSSALISQILRQHFSIRAKVEPLSSYSDQVFKATGDDGRVYTFKIAHAYTTIHFIRAQHAAMRALNSAGETLRVPEIITSASGEDIIEIAGEDRRHFAWLQSFLPGRFLSEVPNKADYCRSIGRLIGNIHRILPACDLSAAQRFSDWDLSRLPLLAPHLPAISSPAQRRLANYFLLQFETRVAPRLSQFPQGVIHGDINEHNLLLLEEKQAHFGLIDFGDMVYSARIFELAIAVAYMLFGLQESRKFRAMQDLVAGYHEINPLSEAELDHLFHMIAGRLVMSVLHSAFHRQRQPKNAYISISEEPAWETLDWLYRTNPVKAANYFREACRFSAISPTPKSALLQKRRARLSPALSIAYRDPLHIIRGAGPYLFDAGGNTFLDGVNNVCHVGHCHPRVVRAAARQQATLNTNTRYLHDNILEYAGRLAETLPEKLSVCFFVNSGSEANDLALRLASAHTGSREMIVLDAAYHGHTIANIAISPYKFDGPGGAGKPVDTHVLPLPGLSDTSTGGGEALQECRTLLEKLAEENRLPVSFIAESLPGCAGQMVLPPDFLSNIYALIRASGGVCIADEVQVGFGRVGSHFWGFETQAVVPDIVTLGKPIGNGHPLAAVITTAEIADSFCNGMEYFNTFGGNPVSCAVGLEVLNIIADEALQENARQEGERLLSALSDLQRAHSLIAEVRGLGLFIGVELRKNGQPAAKEADQIINLLKDDGVLISTDGPGHNVLKIKPPLVWEREHSDFFLEVFDKSLKGIKL